MLAQNYTVSVIVAPVSPSTGTPTGTVAVDDSEGNTCTVTLSGGAGNCDLTSTSTGEKTVTAAYAGDSNYTGSSDTEPHTVGKSDSTTTITSDSPDPSQLGQNYSVNVTVSGDSGTPTGSVDVDDGEGNTCSITLSGGSGSCDLPSISLGEKTVSADYSGDSFYNTSSDTEPHTVSKADTTTEIISDLSGSTVVGQSYQVTVTVSSGGGTPTGTVDVDDGDGNTCQVSLTAGSGSCSLTSTSVGSKTVSADYTGDSNFNTSSDSTSHPVVQGSTVVTITSDASDPSVVGESFTVNVTVAAASPASGTPTGTVDVDDGDGNTCQVTLSGGSGNCSLASTSPGAKTVTASYGGDSNFTSNSDTDGHTVNKANTSTTITSDDSDPSIVGNDYTVAVSVAAAAPGSGTPTGTVDVDDGEGNSCQITLSAGSGSCDLASVSQGGKTLTADYSGDSNFNTSSDTEPHTVNKADTSTSITSDLSGSTQVGQAYTVAVTVGSAGGTPTGTVDVDDGDGNTCQVTLSGGSGSCELTSTSVGSKTVSADYAGDTNFNTSGDSTTHPVIQGATTVTITGDDDDPSLVGESYTVEVSVAAVAPASGTPTGTVDVDDGEGNSCMVTLSAGSGSCALASTSVGGKTLSADYSGDSNFTTSTDTESHTVNQASTTTTITSDSPDPSGISVSYTVSVDVAPVAPASGTPTGTVNINDGQGNSCVATLSAASGSCDLSSSTGGVKTISASYTGDANFAGSSDTESHEVDGTAPEVLFVTTVADTGDGLLSEGEVADVDITQFVIQFSDDLLADGSAHAADNTANYLLFEANGDGFQTVDCATGVDPADTSIAWLDASYTNNEGSDPFESTLDLTGALDPGSYRLLVCGTTSIKDVAGNKLNNGASDYTLNFHVLKPAVPLTPSGSIYELRPTFTWDEISVATWYHLHLETGTGALVYEKWYPASYCEAGTCSALSAKTLTYSDYNWKLKTMNADSIESNYSDPETFQIDPSAPTLNSPADLATSVGAPTHSWGAIRGSSAYQLQYATDEAFSNVVYTSPDVTSNKHTPEFSLLGDYYWRVRAKGLVDNWGLWSESRQVTLLPPIPAAPTLLTPVNKGATNEPFPTLDWSDTSYAVNYHVILSTSKTFDTAIIDEDAVAASEYTSLVELDEGVYYWKVRAQNVDNDWGSWSSASSFTIDFTGPTRPALKKPKDFDLSKKDLLIFKWKGTTKDSLSFRLQVDDDSDFSSPVIDLSGLSKKGYKMPKDQAGLPPGRYFWRVQPTDWGGNIGSWSRTYQFAVTIQKKPKDDSVSTRLPQFQWNKVKEALGYELQIDTTTDFTTPIIEEAFDEKGTKYKPDELTFDYGLYYWRVRYQTEAGWSDWSAICSVYYVPAVPGTPVLLTPLNKSADTSDTPTFTWGDVLDADQYEIEIATDKKFADLVESDTVAVATFTSAGLADGAYYWRVRTYDAYGAYGKWSKPFAFTNLP